MLFFTSHVACYGAALLLFSLLGILYLPFISTFEELLLSSPSNEDFKKPLRKRAIAPQNCVGNQLTSVSNAITEAGNIVNYAVPQLQSVLQILQSNPVPSIIGMNNAQRTVWQTYEAFFGQSYFGVDTVTNRNNNADAISRLQSVIATAQLLQIALQTPGIVNVEIYCDDFFLWEFDAQGAPPQTPGLFWDSRLATVDNPIGEWVNIVRCQDRPTMTAYTYQPNSPPFGGESVIVLCQGKFAAWDARYLAGDRVGNYHNAAPVVTGQYQMDYLWGYLPATLIHELTHTQSIMGANTFLRDQCLINQLPAYQWQCIRQLALENPNLAITNSDSFSLFATAIYFNQNDWSTGIGQNLGYFPLRGP